MIRSRCQRRPLFVHAATHPTPLPQQPSRLLLSYRIMPPLNTRKKSIREVTKERERQRKVMKVQKERGWESSEKQVDITAIGLLRRAQTRSADSVSTSDESDNSESEDDEVLLSEVEEVEEVDESAFEKLMNSSLEQSR